jgi:hypothetical protein
MSHVDSTSPVTHVSLCAGYGGIDLGLHRAIPNLRTIAVSEIEAFACANLVAKMEAGLLDPAPIWTDLKTFPWAEFRDRVDICSFGYPCQPFSAAGKRLGAEDPDTSGLTYQPELLKCDQVSVSPKTSRDISALGYPTFCKTWQDWVTERRGAWRQRVNAARLTRGKGSSSWPGEWSTPQDVRPEAANAGSCGTAQAWPSRPGELANAQLHGRDHANARPNADGIQGPLGQGHEHRQALGDGQLWPSRPGEQQFAWEPPRVVVDAKSQRASDPSEDGSGSALTLSSQAKELWQRHRHTRT